MTLFPALVTSIPGSVTYSSCYGKLQVETQSFLVIFVDFFFPFSSLLRLGLQKCFDDRNEQEEAILTAISVHLVRLCKNCTTIIVFEIVHTIGACAPGFYTIAHVL
jgi:hypothetical protein